MIKRRLKDYDKTVSFTVYFKKFNDLYGLQKFQDEPKVFLVDTILGITSHPYFQLDTLKSPIY